MTETNRAQIAVRTTKPMKALFEEAAEYLGVTTSGFIVAATAKETRRVLGREPKPHKDEGNATGR